MEAAILKCPSAASSGIHYRAENTDQVIISGFLKEGSDHVNEKTLYDTHYNWLYRVIQYLQREPKQIVVMLNVMLAALLDIRIST